MPHDSFFQDLSVVIIVASIVTILFRQMKLPVVLGYILAGFIIGPHTPPYALIKDEPTINTLSELGVIFLMFSLGLEFSLRKLKEVGATAVLGAFMEITMMGFIGYQIGVLFNWNKVDAVFLGTLLAMSSTTIIIKALDELGLMKERFAGFVFGILIVEDIIGILILALISGFAQTGVLSPGSIGVTIIQLSSFLGVVLIFGLMLVPRLLDYVARFKSNEMLLLTVVGLCFGVSLVAHLLNYSVALGAFLIGAVIAEARQIVKIEILTNPVRDLFSAVFFVSIGLLINPAQIIQYWAPILVITFAVVFIKVIACSTGTFLAGNDRRTSLRTGMTLAQIGEFSFIIASLGLKYGLTSDFIYPIAVAVSAITTLLTPFLIKLSDPVATKLGRVAPKPLLQGLTNYTNWIATLSSRNGSNLGATLLKQWGWQIGINYLLITAAFVGARALRPHVVANWGETLANLNPRLGSENSVKAILWLGAMLVCLPMFIAIFRKLQAAGMLVAEMSVAQKPKAQGQNALRGFLSAAVVLAGTVVTAVLVLILSSALLPPAKILIVLALALVVAFLILRRTLVRLYSRAQYALVETFSHPPAQREEERPELPALLHEAELLSVTIDANAWVIGKMIAELKLRSKTGASIVGIERDGSNIVNPAAEEELRPGDHVLLLGTHEQLEASRDFMLTPAATA